MLTIRRNFRAKSERVKSEINELQTRALAECLPKCST